MKTPYKPRKVEVLELPFIFGSKAENCKRPLGFTVKWVRNGPRGHFELLKQVKGDKVKRVLVRDNVPTFEQCFSDYEAVLCKQFTDADISRLEGRLQEAAEAMKSEITRRQNNQKRSRAQYKNYDKPSKAWQKKCFA